MGEAVADVSKLALLHVLLDRVEEVFLGELCDEFKLVPILFHIVSSEAVSPPA